MGEAGGGGDRLTRRDLLGVRIGWGEKEWGRGRGRRTYHDEEEGPGGVDSY